MVEEQYTKLRLECFKYLGKILVVITCEKGDKVRQGLLFSGDYVYRNKVLIC